MAITVSKEGFVNLSDFDKYLDISKVVFYSLKEKNGCIHLKFYDKNKKVVKPYESKKTKENKSKKVQK